MTGDIHSINIADWTGRCTALLATASDEWTLVGWPGGATSAGTLYAIGATT